MKNKNWINLTMVRLVSFLSFGFIPTYSSDPVTPTKKQKLLRSLHSLSLSLPLRFVYPPDSLSRVSFPSYL